MSEGPHTSLSRVLLVVGRLGLAGIFLFAGYAKMKPQPGMTWSPQSVNISLSMFAMQVDSYELLPQSAVNSVAHWLPPFELFLGLWLLSGVALRYSSLAAALLIAGLFLVVMRSFAAGLEINCGCFGPGEKLGPWTLVRDGSMLVAAMAVTVGAFVVHRRQATRDVSVASSAAPQRADS